MKAPQLLTPFELAMLAAPFITNLNLTTEEAFLRAQELFYAAADYLRENEIHPDQK
jgi:hypothetical protein